VIRSQFYSFQGRYREEVAPCRTFSLYEDIAPFIEKGLIKGGGLSNALVVQGDHILNPEGARFPDEMVRHKVLDLIGDLSLIGSFIQGHILSVRSGHAANIAFAKLLYREGAYLQ
jgi:UDP-3-O-[3-hydroxymyristoyl] N-acetylglucosamine deacetylase